MTSHSLGGTMNKQQRVYIDGKIFVARGNGYVRVR
ncbi:hypothetical protein GOOSE_87 [Mycobacterium phage Goose]|uniref:Uncharacterized protein n=3 Tax=Fromanvirus goose TaxID=1211282 RepID=A0A291AV33_9CAUD|nr:hypothetical protein FGG46_gp07 [Mycobacterium phage Goose]AFU20707.1 hypothetical protein GOOSE_87 [Mycobacterium phage Goose]ATE84823.1 hypothetical protein OKCENTRAL2016_85 [Mycobacterium phage OKCentral2016]